MLPAPSNTGIATPTALSGTAGGLPEVWGFYEPLTSSVQYVVADPTTKRCAIVDPVLDYDERSGSFATKSADRLLEFIGRCGLVVDWILDTHPHADHCSAVNYLTSKTGASSGTGERIAAVRELWQEIYSSPLESEFEWDALFADGEHFQLGSLRCQVIHSPGHTLASVTFVVENCAFVHDTLFMPDSGTARADFPGGSARSLWRSIGTILDLPNETLLFSGHDYQPGNRSPAWKSTVAEQKAGNVHLRQYPSEAAFIEFRNARDASLPLPRLMLQALQVNLNGGQLPRADARGKRFLKIPIGAFESAAWKND